MRKIEFRGKRIDNGEWVYGYYLSYGVDMYSCGEIIGTKDEHYIITPCHEDFSYEHTFEIRKETLCQYTGLKDKNGIDIYEGDILKLWRSVGQNGALRGEHIPLEVVYCNQWCQFVVLNKSCKEQFGIWQQFGAFEVVGNIHDNPELLEV